MNLVCDIGHPAHVHLFKNMLWQLVRRGHAYLVTTRARDVTLALLRNYRIPFVSFGKRYGNLYGKAYGLVRFDYLMFKVAKRFRPDIFISHGSMYAAHVAALMGKPHISLEDTDNTEQVRLYKPFTRTILTSTCFPEKFGRKQIRYEGYHEIAYLHPRYFKPNPTVLHRLGVKPSEKYVVLRFVDWKATHDMNHTGILDVNKILAVKEFLEYARVFISAEGHLPYELDKYRISIPPEYMHSVLHYATLYYGESGTMASECAVLGTPAIFLDDTGRRYTDEQEKKYGLVHNFTESIQDQRSSIKKAVELLKSSNVKKRYKQKRGKILKEKIDVTAFLLWFVENYPVSIGLAKKHSNLNSRFRRTGLVN